MKHRSTIVHLATEAKDSLRQNLTWKPLSRHWAKPIFALVVLQLSGCGAVVAESVSITADKTKVRNNIVAARAGDPVAQYVVGKAMCCSGSNAEGTFYSTKDALESRL